MSKVVPLPGAAKAPVKQPKAKKDYGKWGEHDRLRPPGTMSDDRKRVRLIEDGKEKSFTGQTMAEARAKKEAYKREKAQAKLEAPDVIIGAPPKKTVAAWADEWFLVYYKGGEVETSVTKSVVKRIKESNIGPLLLGDVSQLDVQKFANANIHSKSHTAKIRSALMHIMDAAVDNKMIENSPCLKVRWENTGEEGHRALEQWEYDLITNNWHRHPAGIGAMLMLYSGERPEEARAQNWDNITGEHIAIRDSSYFNISGQLILKPGVTKTKAGQRDIPIMPQLADMIADLERKAGQVVWYSASGTLVKQSAYNRNWDAFMNILRGARLGVPPNKLGSYAGVRIDKLPDKVKAEWEAIFEFSPYSLRHTFCTMLYDAGVDVKTMQYLMGHNDVQTTLKIYAKLTEAKKQRTYEEMKAHFIAEKARQSGAVFEKVDQNVEPKSEDAEI